MELAAVIILLITFVCMAINAEMEVRKNNMLQAIYNLFWCVILLQLSFLIAK